MLKQKNKIKEKHYEQVKKILFEICIQKFYEYTIITKSKKFLFERISLAIQRGNAASIRGTFPDSPLSEIFIL
jgi:hypothetical protein